MRTLPVRPIPPPAHTFQRTSRAYRAATEGTATVPSTSPLHQATLAPKIFSSIYSQGNERRHTQQEKRLPASELTANERKLALRELERQVDEDELLARRRRGRGCRACAARAVLGPSNSRRLESDDVLLVAERWDLVYFGAVKVFFDAAHGNEGLPCMLERDQSEVERTTDLEHVDQGLREGVESELHLVEHFTYSQLLV